MTRPLDPTASARLLAVVAGLDAHAAGSALIAWTERLDWAQLPRTLALPGDATLEFDRRRRQAYVRSERGGTLQVDLGRQDRMRDRDDVLTGDLVQEVGPSIERLMPVPYLDGTGEVSVRDPLDAKGKATRDLHTVGPVPVSRFLDADGVPRLIGYGDLSDVSGFGTTLMGDGSAYASLRTHSGLAGIHDSRRLSFRRAVTAAHADEARATGYSAVATKDGVVGVLVDAGGPGHHVVLAAYGGPGGGTIGYVVDLRRPPVKDGAIVDPA